MIYLREKGRIEVSCNKGANTIMSVNRCYSEKKNGFDVEARSLFSSLHDLLEIKNLTHVRYLCRYDAE